MSDWYGEPVVAKNKRRGVLEQPPIKGGRNRAPRKWSVIGPGFFGKGKFVWHRAATKELCEAWVAKQARSYYVSPHATEQQRAEYQRRAEERTASYQIVGPKDEHA